MAGNLDEPASDARPRLVHRVACSAAARGSRTFAEINETIESVGASIGFSSDRHITNFSTKSLAEDLDLVLDVLADELRAAGLPRALRRPGARPAHDRAGRARERHPADGRPRVPRADVRRSPAGPRHARHPRVDRRDRPRRARRVLRDVLPAAGDGGRRRWCACRPRRPCAGSRPRSATGTGAAPPRPALPPTVPDQSTCASATCSMPDKTQSDIMLGWPGMRRLDPDFDPARLANTVLGVFGMMGRLGENVRERQGMAYYAYSRVSGDREPGTWVTDRRRQPGQRRARAAGRCSTRSSGCRTSWCPKTSWRTASAI